MPQLVITCHPDGSVETLLKDKVFDSRKLADSRKVERLSEVLPTEDGQHFFIRWLKGPLVGNSCITLNNKPVSSLNSISVSEGSGFWEKQLFDSYEQAVEYEVYTVNALRLKGHTFV